MTVKEIIFRKATTTDIPAICDLLARQGLPTEDIKFEFQDFIVAEKESVIIGNVGIECYGDAALLRSLAVNSENRNKGLASILIEALISIAAAKSINTIYLVTNTAESYFEKKGFKRINKNQVDSKLLGATEFNGLCPASATIMMKQL